MPETRRKKPGEAQEPKNKITGLPPEFAKALTERRRNADAEQLLLDLVEVRGGTHRVLIEIGGDFQKGPGW